MSTTAEVKAMLEGLFIRKTDENKNPFVGLRPYEADEGHLFFGRDAQIKALLEKLHTSRFLSIVGSSGCGKSSLIRAGVIPKLQGGFLTQKRDRWLIAIMRPSGNPLEFLASALKKSFQQYQELYSNPFVQKLCGDSILQSGTTEFVEKMKEIFHENRFNLLILVDQFEELFTYKTKIKNDKKEESEETKKNKNIFFVNLLMTLATVQELPVYLTITMRSDYIGHCNRFLGLPELLNDTQYLVPKLKWQQVREVIEFPIKLFGQKINPGLLDLLTNDSDKEIDQLPVLQHCLMRTYQNWINDGRTGDIEFIHYEKTGKLNGALCRHANEVYNSLSKKQQKIAEYIFKAITEFNADYEPVRIPRKFKHLLKICEAVDGVSKEEILDVINVFRKKDCAFLFPSESANITEETRIDVSHESLLRQWDILRDDKLKGALKDGWMIEEQRSADKLYWLSECVLAEKKEYLGRLGAAEAEKWLNKQNPNNAWAQRYVSNLDDIVQFIKDSKRKSQRKNLLFISSICVSAVAVIAVIFFIAKANISTARAAAKEQIALIDAAKAKVRLDSAKAKAILDSAKAKAMLDSTNAKAVQTEALRKIDLANAQAKVDLANAKAETEKQKNDYFYKRIPEILQLVNAPFYKSGLMDSARRDMFVNRLVELKYKDQKIEEYDNLLKDLNTTIEIFNTAEKDPNQGLLMARKFDSTSKNPLSDSMLRYVAGNYFFYVADTTFSKDGLDYNDTRGMTAISVSRKLFAVKLDDTIKIFKLNSEGLSFFKAIPINLDLYYKNSKSSYNETTGPNTMTFVNEDSLVALINNKIYRIDINDAQFGTVLIPDLNKENVYERYYTSTISPDGKKLAIDYKDYNVKIFDIDNSYDTLQIALIHSDGFVDNIDFAADNNTVIVKQRDTYTILNIADLKANPNLRGKVYLCANLTPDNKYVIVQQRSGVVELHDLKKDSLISSVIFTNIGIDTFKNAVATSLSLSPDWKKLIIKTNTYQNYQSTSSTYYFERNKKAVIFPFGRQVTSKDSEKGKLIKLNYLNTSRVFLNNDNLLSSNSGYYDSVRLWKKYDIITDGSRLNLLAARIAAVTKKESNFDDLSANIDTLTDLHPVLTLWLHNDLSADIDTVTNIQQLAAAGDTAVKRDSMYLQKQTLYDAKKIYGRLSALDSKKYLSEYRRLSRNYFTYYADTVERIDDLKKITFLEENLLKSDVNDTLMRNLSSDYWNLSWYLLFKKGYEATIYAAKRGLALNPMSTGINTNLALGYLLSGQCEQAFGIYKAYKNKQYASDERKFNDAFLQDLDDLEEKGVIKQEDTHTYERVQQVRRFLRGEEGTLDCKN